MKKSKKSFLVLRAQLPKNNPFFETPPDDCADMEEPAEEDIDSEWAVYRQQHSATLCDVCGQPGSKKCGACHTFHYCSPAHQKLHWTIGEHSKHCATLKHSDISHIGRRSWTDETNPVLFNEFEIVTESESETKQRCDKELEDKQKALLDKYYKEMEEEKKEGSQSDQVEFKEEDMPKNRHDPVFIKFQTTIDVDPSQVLRYTSDTAMEPLWMCSGGILKTQDIPRCALCGSERAFELQILPQLIYHLKVQRNLVSGNPDDEIDFGVLIIYTCKASCEVNPSTPNRWTSGKYAIEYLYHQKYE